ncbi:hypothetical protein ACO2J1_11660 [Leptospira interrogans]|uniref:Uncharacterized protein n=3 Tax=Leptospira interrogans TaxID=173 RepID=A0AAP9WNV1_LEPIR|nr:MULTISPECIES: hypothetical protein [Leptospira]KAA1293716.1 hypothetical protein C4X99_01140 [Leptospira interrogans serovar Geyaweera]EJO77410.1 putative membrane protein [Leptospira interrogans serovar Pomona str. Kennewicki LC82-25]EKN95411.1 putative membrane protein [Leptospira interrogans serovar Pomona str. Pomona]EKO24997.1 putative membrane protein [Leptospira interrogans str. UI 12621]EKO70319.1 putative membrane protein [Leptospira interrogans serovar Canicola str. Fiocruz LV133]
MITRALQNKIFFSFLICFLFVVFLFDLRFLSRHYDWDAIVYAYNINSDLIWRIFYNPHHLGFESSGYLYLKLWREWFGKDSVMFGLRLRILISALLFLFCFIYMYRKIYSDTLGAIVLGLAVHFSQGFWFYAQHNDTPLIHSCLIAALYLFCVYFTKKGHSPISLITLFTIQLFGVYFHQSDILFLPLVPISILFSQTWKGKNFELTQKLRYTLIYCFLLIGILTLSYLYVGFILLNRNLSSPLDSERNFANWLFLYATKDKWGNSPEAKNYVMNFYRGIGDAFLNFEGVKNGLRVRLHSWEQRESLPYNLNLTFWILIFCTFFFNFKNIWKRFQIETILLLFWLIPSILFYTWWEGYFFEFWVGTSIGMILLAGLTLKSIEFETFSFGSRAIYHSILFIWCLLLFLINFSFSTFPRSKKKTVSYIQGIEFKLESILPEKIYPAESEKTSIFDMDSKAPSL